MNPTEILTRLTSRKFLIALTTVGGLLANKQYGEAAAVAIGYLAAEGAIDVRSAKQATKSVAEELEEVVRKLDELETEGAP